ncbi:J domain-containing protein [Actinomadura alba]|uniref:J domain-containing protein n=1 Tax=Actinomadura alba TaxID=406431 RepID=UPI001C9C6005|nr:J domain-containing protein [Actinomadura alba]
MSVVSVRRDAERPWRDYNKILGVELSASARKITSAYRRLVRTLHPDSHPERPTAGERFGLDGRGRVWFRWTTGWR